MFHRMLRKARKQDGFTLIELIVVVAILGILAAVLTPRVLDAVQNARTSAAEANAKQIQLAMERYLIKNNNYPAEEDVADPTVLADTLREFANINAAAMIDEATIDNDFVYAGYSDEVGDTSAWVEDDDPNVNFYRLFVTFEEGPITYMITPNSVVPTDTPPTDDDI